MDSGKEAEQRAQVMSAIREHIRSDRQIKLPDFDRALSRPGVVGFEPNPFGGTVGDYRYQFEGEEDLLHLIITRLDECPLTVEEARPIAGWLLPDLPPALMWLRPGQYSQHFYFGHDELMVEDR
jgi:hypothetical protein